MLNNLFNPERQSSGLEVAVNLTFQDNVSILKASISKKGIDVENNYQGTS